MVYANNPASLKALTTCLSVYPSKVESSLTLTPPEFSTKALSAIAVVG
jgi:hypothetical protein